MRDVFREELEEFKVSCPYAVFADASGFDST